MENNLIVELNTVLEKFPTNPIEFAELMVGLMNDVEQNNSLTHEQQEGILTTVLGVMSVYKFSTSERNEALHDMIYEMANIAASDYARTSY